MLFVTVVTHHLTFKQSKPEPLVSKRLASHSDVPLNSLFLEKLHGCLSARTDMKLIIDTL